MSNDPFSASLEACLSLVDALDLFDELRRICAPHDPEKPSDAFSPHDTWDENLFCRFEGLHRAHYKALIAVELVKDRLTSAHSIEGIQMAGRTAASYAELTLELAEQRLELLYDYATRLGASSGNHQGSPPGSVNIDVDFEWALMHHWKDIRYWIFERIKGFNTQALKVALRNEHNRVADLKHRQRETESQQASQQIGPWGSTAAMAGRTPPTNRELLHELAPFTDAGGLDATDDELLAFIGGILEDRKRWAHTRHAKENGINDEGTAVRTWLDRHPNVTAWLEARNLSLDDAVAANEEWSEKQRRETEITEKYGQRKRALLHPESNLKMEVVQKPATVVDLLAGNATFDDLTDTGIAQADNPEKEPCILYHGNKQYSITGSDPFAVTDVEHFVLEAFINKKTSALSKSDLENASGVSDAVRYLRRLKKKYDGIFAPAIHLPGGKGRGGYRVTIRSAE